MVRRQVVHARAGVPALPAQLRWAFEAKFGDGHVLDEVVKSSLVKAKMGPPQFATVIQPAASRRAPRVIARALGRHARKQLLDSFWTDDSATSGRAACWWRR